MGRRRHPATLPPGPAPAPLAAWPPPGIGHILDAAYQALRKAGRPAPEPGREAEFLDIGRSYLSKLRNGRQAIPLKWAAAFAKRLAGGSSAEERRLREALVDARLAHVTSVTSVTSDVTSPLFDVTSITSDVTLSDEVPRASRHADVVGAVQDFFLGISGPRRLLCVDYRDMPQAVDDGAYPSTILYAIDAVKSGLSFAMFQPFGPEEHLRKLRFAAPTDHPSWNLYEFLADLAGEVRTFYKKLLDAVDDRSACQVALYEMDAHRLGPARDDFTGCGIQSRTFYVDYEDATSRRVRSVHEWVAGSPEHVFVERSADSLRVHAVREQFSPVVPFWYENDHALPRNEDLKAIYEARARDGLPSHRRWVRWSHE